MKTQGIYLIRNTVSGRVYVGSSVDIPHRIRTHKALLKAGKQCSRTFQASWLKHGAASFEFSILELVENQSDLIAREQHWIDTLHATCPDRGFNVRLKAESCLGFRHTDEAKRRIGEASRTRIVSLETRRRQSVALTGKRLTEATKAKLRAANLGKKSSDETRAKQSAKLKGRKVSAAAIARTIEVWTGREHTAEAKAKMSAIKVAAWAAKQGIERAGYWAGKARPPETRAKMTASHKARWARMKAERNRLDCLDQAVLLLADVPHLPRRGHASQEVQAYPKSAMPSNGR